MIPLDITTNIERAPWTDLGPALRELGLVSRIGRLPRGTTTGKSTVSIVIELPDGKRVVGQTTLALLEHATRVLRAAEDRENS